MKEIILVGGFHEMIELCEEAGFNIIGIIDNELTGVYYGYPVIGTDNEASSLYKQYPNCQVVITPDSPRLRKKLVEFYHSAGFSFATIIHPAATVSRFATIGEGTVVQQGVNVSANTKIGDFCKLNTGCNVMHDNAIGNYATIAPNAVLLGYVTVGELSYIGANSTILPKISIGGLSTVGAGAVVTKNVQSNLVVAGIPAKELVK
jgi:sugar O-acyltransferase (sialic acid O-acetyltransferase NeuD family)